MEDLSDRTVLIVDDTEANVDILVEALADVCDIAVAMDGESALEIVAESPVDLILLDVMMPGIDGFEVCRRLKAAPQTAHIPVIFITAMTDLESKTKGFEIGAVDYVTKPFEIREVQARTRTHLELVLQREKSEQLLANILPRKVIDELKTHGASKPELFPDVTILFSDVTNFTHTSSQFSPDLIIDGLSEMFTAFDAIMERHGCERIKTIGDAYLAVCGMPEQTPDHARHMVEAAQDMVRYLDERNRAIEAADAGIPWEVRIGVHTGEVVGGIVGTTKYIYDVFGDAVNTASRAEQASEPMRITVTHATYELAGDSIDFEARGPVELKGKGSVPLYFVRSD